MGTEPHDQEFYDQLLGYLTAEGTVVEDAGTGTVVLFVFEHRELDPPMRLHITPETFGQHLRAAAPDSAGVFPDVTAIEAAWRLFTVHLMEAVLSAKPGETELLLDRTGVVARAP